MKTFSVAFRAFSYILGALLLFGWTGPRIRSFERRLGLFILPDGMEWPGIFLVIGGGILMSLCCQILIEHGQWPPCIFYPPKAFVLLGPYKYVRNPMYVGEVLLLIGVGLYYHLTFVAILALVWFFLLHLLVIYYEEPTLKKK